MPFIAVSRASDKTVVKPAGDIYVSFGTVGFPEGKVILCE